MTFKRPIPDHSADELRNIITNFSKHGKADDPRCLGAMEELARRTGNGLDFEKSLALIRAAAADGRYISYKQLADESGADWSRVHYSVFNHLGDLIDYAHRKGWPLLSAIVVSQPNIKTGAMDGPTIEGFLNAARMLGFQITDGEAFLREQQRLVFEWAGGSPPAREDGGQC